jgi:hypothetical protein
MAEITGSALADDGTAVFHFKSDAGLPVSLALPVNALSVLVAHASQLATDEARSRAANPTRVRPAMPVAKSDVYVETHDLAVLALTLRGGMEQFFDLSRGQARTLRDQLNAFEVRSTPSGRSSTRQ